MKQLIIAATLLTVFAPAAKAQEICHATNFTTARFDTATGKYDWSTAAATDLRITLSRSTLSIDDQAGSFFTLGQPTANMVDEDGTRAREWKATDKNGVECILQMVKYANGARVITVFYGDSGVMYAIPA